MTQPASAPDTSPAAYEHVTDPIEKARLICLVARRIGNLPAPLAELRKEALRAARNGGERRVTWLAAQVGLTPSRICQLTKVETEGAAA